MNNYYVYIMTNKYRTVFYTGITSNLSQRIRRHASGIGSSFTSRYRLRYLLYFEEYSEVTQSIQREKQIKGWTRRRKLDLIRRFNPDMQFLNEQVWTP